MICLALHPQHRKLWQNSYTYNYLKHTKKHAKGLNPMRPNQLAPERGRVGDIIGSSKCVLVQHHGQFPRDKAALSTNVKLNRRHSCPPLCKHFLPSNEQVIILIINQKCIGIMLWEYAIPSCLNPKSRHCTECLVRTASRTTSSWLGSSIGHRHWKSNSGSLCFSLFPHENTLKV